MGWSSDRRRAFIARAEAQRLRGHGCNHRTDDERALCSCDCHRRPAVALPVEHRGPKYVKSGNWEGME